MKGRPELMKLMASVDVHAPAKLRVNVQVPNFDDFFTTYDVKEGDGMWRATRGSCDYLVECSIKRFR